MKNIYTLFYSLNNTGNEDENYLFELSEIEKNEMFLKETLDRIKLSPGIGVIEEILKLAREK